MSDLAFVLRVAGRQLDSFGGALVERIGALNVTTAALLAGALLCDRLIARRARASLRIALYAPVALRVLLPLDWSIPLARAPRVKALLAPLARIGAHPTMEAAWHAPTWNMLAAVAHLTVVALLVTRVVVARVRLRRALAGARPLQTPHAALPCPVVEHEHLGPMTVGLFAPRIVLPRRLLRADAEQALACVLRHESAHVRRGDAWLAAAMQLLAILAWPVLPLWIAMARVRNLVELACDESALANADAMERRRYGHALLDLAEWQSFGVAPIDAGALHFGAPLRARIEALAAQRPRSPAAQALAVAFVPVAMLAACSASVPPSDTTAASEAEGYGYAFEGDSAKAAGAATSAPSPPLSASSRLPPEVIQATVRARFGAFRVCYEAGQKRNPKLEGTVTVRYAFGEDGITKEAADEKSTLPDPEVVACVVDAFRKITYPKGRGGVVTVVYPVVFSP